ncbi:MAG: YjdF family protein [Lachnospiraceae bacterium]|nr:YjdF family protein [Lachnospiraceae bacterium]
MEKCQGRLTVFFEDPFWVGVFERVQNGRLSAAKTVFGAEPKDYEVQEFINRNYYRLKFSPAVKTIIKDVRKNPKRAQRDAKKQTLEKGIGTKSQQALKLQQEQNKEQRKERSRKEREAVNDMLFEKKQQKKKEKHKGH